MSETFFQDNNHLTTE